MREEGREWRALSWLGLAILLGLIAGFGTDSGISYDEYSQSMYGNYVLAWFQSGFTDRSAMHFRDLYLYGGMFDLVAQWVAQHLPYRLYDTRHVLEALTALLGVAATWRLGALAAGPRAGFLSALVLSLTPCWIGHGLMNPKDVPFATATAFASVSALQLALGPAPVRFRDMLWAGVTVGFALAVRPGGNFVVAYPLMAAGLRITLELFRRRQRQVPLELLRLVFNHMLCVLVVCALGWAIMISTWPWAQIHPLDHPLEAMWRARHFSWPGTVLFDGKYYPSNHLPSSYLPLLFGITLPEIYFLAAAAVPVLLAGLVLRRRKPAGERVLGWIMLAAFVVFPLSAVLITRASLYDAHRHVLFLVPPAAALAGAVLSELFAAEWLPRLARGAVATAFAGLSLLVATDIVQVHPFEYTYFNRLSGGLQANYERFDTDYWSIGYRQGVDLVLEKLLPANPTRPTRIISCDSTGDDRLLYYVSSTPSAAGRVVVTSDPARADLLIAVRRAECHRRPGSTLATVDRQGAPLVYIRRIQQ